MLRSVVMVKNHSFCCVVEKMPSFLLCPIGKEYDLILLFSIASIKDEKICFLQKGG